MGTPWGSVLAWVAAAWRGITGREAPLASPLEAAAAVSISAGRVQGCQHP